MSLPRRPLGSSILRRLYSKECLTTGEVADRLNCSDEHVRRQLISFGIKRRNSGFALGEANPAYVDGHRIGRYKKRGWNPWNKGKSKKTDSLIRKIALKISRTFRTRKIGFNMWETRQDAVRGLHRLADLMQKRERNKYRWILKKLGKGWIAEFFDESFIFRRLDGKWSGIIADIANPHKKKMIELDGNEHREWSHAISDKWRDTFLKKIGWRVYRIPVQTSMDISIYR